MRLPWSCSDSLHICCSHWVTHLVTPPRPRAVYCYGAAACPGVCPRGHGSVGVLCAVRRAGMLRYTGVDEGDCRGDAIDAVPGLVRLRRGRRGYQTVAGAASPAAACVAVAVAVV
jgi:hypothetical protein